jgi:hypothetical protein
MSCSPPSTGFTVALEGRPLELADHRAFWDGATEGEGEACRMVHNQDRRDLLRRTRGSESKVFGISARITKWLPGTHKQRPASISPIDRG